jgi:hypothetical protein
MTCTECNALMDPQDVERKSSVCRACAAENAVYETYGHGIEVPKMWDEVQRRIAAEATHRRGRRTLVAWSAAIAAVLAAMLFLTPFVRQPASPEPSVQTPPLPAVVAASRYEAAIATLEAELQTADAPRRAEAAMLLPQLTNVVAQARKAMLASPQDPVAVSLLMSAYDAKLEFLRDVVHAQA